MGITRQYHNWDRPFTLAFAEALRSGGGGAGEFDDWLIWVPSSRAGRHILGELFTGEVDEAEAFHPPRFVTPAHFIRSLKGGARVASDAQQLYAWKRVLLRARPQDLRPLFPVLPEAQRENWAYGIARQFMRLRERLAEDNWDFRRVAGASLPFDRERWAALAGLEEAYLETLAAADLLDPDHAFNGRMPGLLAALPYRRLLVAGVLNLSHRQAACVEALAAHGLEVEIHIPAPLELAGQFDEWGRPCKESWETQALPEELLQGRVQRAAEPRELISKTLELAEVYASEVDALVLGAPETEMRDYLIERSRLSAAPFYAPEGKALSATDWGRFLALLAEWHNGASLPTALELLRHSLFRNWAHAAGCPVGKVERALLRLQKERLIQTLAHIHDNAFEPDGSIATVREFSEQVTALLEPDPAQPFPEWLWGVLHAIAISGELQAESREVLNQLEELLQDLNAEFSNEPLPLSDSWEILRFLLDSESHYPERGADERPVSGWLELPWETAPHLVLLGLPDSEVPGPDSTDSFLTPSLCRELGLYGPEEAAAFHAFRLRLLLESRRHWGRMDILLADRGLDDAPVLPCRFLFLSGDEDILNRVQLLLGEQSVPETSLAATFGASLRLPPPPALESISVTSFSAYLGSPFRFYLERLLGWQVPQPLPSEMDALAFGKLAHSVMEALNRSDEGAGLVDPKTIVDFVETRLADEVGFKFGSRPGVPVRIQADSMRERLRAAARVIAFERQQGWKPVKTEWAFHREFDFLIAGVPLHGVIDLLEKNEDTGAYRIIDYKTSDKSDGPEKAHKSSPNRNSQDPLVPECDFMLGEKRHRWKDLQLPLYQLAVQQHLGNWPLCGYLTLTKAISDIQLQEWSPGPEYGEAAMKCAEAIVRRIQDGHFPLEGISRYEDPWLTWFGGDYEANLDGEWLKAHAEVQP